MILKRSIEFVLLFLLVALSAYAQTNNLLQNPTVDEGASFWRAYGDATVVQTADGNWRFVVRNNGHFRQDVELPGEAIGKYALLIGRAASERINADGAITGLPYLYGYMMPNPKGEGILSYLQSREMLCPAKKENEWVTLSGIFQVPGEARVIRFFLNQAERKDVPQNGSAAWFDDLGLYLFDTEAEARAFVKAYEQQKH
jgi:hypothetical protein